MSFAVARSGSLDRPAPTAPEFAANGHPTMGYTKGFTVPFPYPGRGKYRPCLHPSNYVSDLAMPGKGVSFDLYQQPVTR
jgi:hypothetical protein